MSFAEKFERTFRKFLPSPFTIAVLLTLLTMVLAWAFGNFSGGNRMISVLNFWQNGLWNPPLLVFMVQMMLILVLGHTLALAPAVNRLIRKIVSFARNQAQAAFLVTVFTILVALFNWGLGLIFGAILARTTKDRFAREGKPLNYALIGAAGYSGLMVWHGGISGSAPIKVAESGHLQGLMQGIATGPLPESISYHLTIFSPMNLAASILLLTILPLLMYLAGKFSKGKKVYLAESHRKMEVETSPFYGADRLDQSRILCYGLGFLILGYCFFDAIWAGGSLSFITPDYLNFTMLGLCLVFHGNFHRFLSAVDEAIGGAAGILIQFPLYFGIMGIMRESGLIGMISSYFISVSNETTFPIFTLLSAGLVNIFVPSGGGQWAIQGPILLEAAQKIGVGLPKSIMALAYGDQLTNMLQPFWALPLLGITGLKARDIIPYSLALMGAGFAIFVVILLLF